MVLSETQPRGRPDTSSGSAEGPGVRFVPRHGLRAGRTSRVETASRAVVRGFDIPRGSRVRPAPEPSTARPPTSLTIRYSSSSYRTASPPPTYPSAAPRGEGDPSSGSTVEARLRQSGSTAGRWSPLASAAEAYCDHSCISCRLGCVFEAPPRASCRARHCSADKVPLPSSPHLRMRRHSSP